MKTTKEPAATESPESRLKGFIDKFDDAVARQIRLVRKAVRKRLPLTQLIADTNFPYHLTNRSQFPRDVTREFGLTPQ